MITLLTSVICGICSFLLATILLLRLPGWMFFCGLNRVKLEKLDRIDVPRLRRALSFLFYLLGGGFLAVSLLFYLKTLPEKFVIPLLILLIMVIFNLIRIMYRHFDHNGYSKRIRQTSTGYLIFLDCVFLFLIFLFLR